MPAWERFFIAVTILLVVIVSLTRLSQRAIHATPSGQARVRQEPLLGDDRSDPDGRPVTTGELYANVVLSHGLFALILVALIWWFQIPLETLGLALPDRSTGWFLAVGIVAGVVLYVLNESSVAILDRLHLEYSEKLRSVLAPRTVSGWALLLVVVLPVIAGFEELLFRGVLVGALGTATGVSAWLLGALSSIVFALGHGIQGQGGVIVTGALGFLLAGLFILTESLLVVVVAHYLVNALEFVVNEGIARPWLARLPG